MSYKTIWEPNGVYQVFSGVLTKFDRIMANKEVQESPFFNTINYWIIDSLEIDAYEPEAEDAVDAAAQDIGAAFTNKSVQMAFATSNSVHIQNIEKYIKILKKSHSIWKIEIFKDMESVREWISNA